MIIPTKSSTFAKKLLTVLHNKPITKDIEVLSLADFTHYELDNGIEVYELNFPDSAEVIKLDIVYKSGRLYEDHKLTSKICAALLKEGSSNYDSKSTANTLEFYGAYIEASSSMDYGRISVLCLNKHFVSISDLVHNLINFPSFDKGEFIKHKKRAIENLKMQLSKNDIVGYRELTEHIFGPDHPYGYNSVQIDYENVQLSQVEDHFRHKYTTDNCKLFISGNITEELRAQVGACISSVSTPGLIGNLQYGKSDYKCKNRRIRIKGEQNIQKAIYIGGKLFGRNHPDYLGMLMLNTLLGGYFSSRLNRRIREEEALTYGIDAQLDIMREDGFFFISTEVENKNEVPVVNAIYEELELLRTELVQEQELDNVKRYIKGQVLSSLDGPFKQIKVLQSMVINDIDPLLFSDRVLAIDHVSTQDLLRLAKKYFAEERLIEVVVSGVG